jgi:hypothetical protein
LVKYIRPNKYCTCAYCAKCNFQSGITPVINISKVLQYKTLGVDMMGLYPWSITAYVKFFGICKYTAETFTFGNPPDKLTVWNCVYQIFVWKNFILNNFYQRYFHYSWFHVGIKIYFKTIVGKFFRYGHFFWN